MLIIVSSFSLIPPLRLLDRREFPLSYSLRGGFRQDVPFSYTIIITTTQMRSQMLCLYQTKTQKQGLTGYSSVRLTSRASHRPGKCRLSWVWLGFGLLSALSKCSACLWRGSHRHASSGFVTGTDWPDSSVLTWPSPYIVLFWWRVSLTLLELVLVRSFSYTPRAGFSEEFLLHSLNCFSQEFLLHCSRARFSEEFVLHSSSWF